jgi:hypothetical protein
VDVFVVVGIATCELTGPNVVVDTAALYSVGIRFRPSHDRQRRKSVAGNSRFYSSLSVILSFSVLRVLLRPPPDAGIQVTRSLTHCTCSVSLNYAHSRLPTRCLHPVLDAVRL